MPEAKADCELPAALATMPTTEISAGAHAVLAVIELPSVAIGVGVPSPPNVAPNQLAMALTTAHRMMISVAKTAKAIMRRRLKVAALARVGWRLVFLGEVIDLG